MSDSFYLASESDTGTTSGAYGKNYNVDSGAVTSRTSAAYSNRAVARRGGPGGPWLLGLRPKPRGGFAARANYWGLRPQ